MTNGLEDVISKYGTSLEETRKLVGELSTALKKKRKYPFLKTPVYLLPEELPEYGIELEEPLPEGWMLKIAPVEGAEPEVSFITPEKWEMKGVDLFVSPEGKEYSKAGYLTLTREWEAPPAVAPPELAPPTIPGEIPEAIGAVFGEGEVEEIVGWLTEDEANIETFLELVFRAGRTTETETLLRQLGATDEEIEEFFFAYEFERMPITEKAKFVFSEAEGWHKIPAALAVVGSYWEKYANRPWLSLHLTGILSHPETEREWEALGIMLDAQERYGWASIFSDEVSKVWSMLYHEQTKTGKVARTFEKYTNPVYWLPIGTAVGTGARMVSRIPVLGKIALRTAAAIQKAEIVAGYPIAKPIEKAYIRFFTPVIKRELYRWGAERGIVKFDPAVENFAVRVALRYVPPGKLTKTAIAQMFRRRGLEYIATYAGEMSAEEAGRNVVRYIPLLAAGGMGAQGAGETTMTSLVNITTAIISRDIPKATITAQFIAAFVPKGATLEKTVSLVAQLKEMGYSAEAIGVMDANEAWANLFKEVAPEIPPEAVAPTVDISKMSEAEARKIVEQSEHLFIDIPASEEIIKAALRDNWLKGVSQQIAKLPGGKKIIRLIDPRELISWEIKSAQDIIDVNGIVWREITKMGGAARAIKVNELQGITTNPVKMFGFNTNAYSTKMAKRLLPEHEGIVEAGTLEHVFTHPEMYNWEGFRKGLDYVTRTHEINTEVLRLAMQEGVAPEHISEEWWIHRVVEGKYDANGELIAIRGRPGMRGRWAGVPSYGMSRKAASMYEGMSWRIKYGANPEVSVGTYIEEVFNQIAKKRFFEGADKALDAIGKAGKTPTDILKELYPEVVEMAELTTAELGDAAKFHSVINRGIRGEKIPEQTLRAIEKRFPELGRRFRTLVEKPATAEKELRQLLTQSQKVIKDLQAQLKAKKPDVGAIKAQSIEAIPDEQKLAEAFRLMDYEDRLAFRSTMENQLEEIAAILNEQEMELGGIQEFLKTDPVAIYRGHIGKRYVSLLSVLKKGQFPETFTVKEAQMLMMGKTPKTVIQGRVPREVVVDELADHFNMTEQQLIDHIESIAEQKQTLEDLMVLTNLADGRLRNIKRMLGILDGVDITPAFIPKVEPSVLPIEPVVEVEVGKRVSTLGAAAPKKAGEYRLDIGEQVRARPPQITSAELNKIIARIPDVDDVTLINYWVTKGDEEVYIEGWSNKCIEGWGYPLREEEGAYETFFEVGERLTPEIIQRKAGERGLEFLEGGWIGLPNAVELYGVTYGVYRKLPVGIPKAEVGMPEAGLQQDMFGYTHPVFPAGKGEITQISLDEYNRLCELRKVAGLEGPPPNIAIKPPLESIKGLEPEAISRVTTLQELKNLEVKLGMKIVERFRLDPRKPQSFDDAVQRLLARKEEIIPPESEQNFINAMRRLQNEAGIESAKFKPFAQPEFTKVTFEVSAVKSVAERKAGLEALRKEVKNLVEARKLPYWKARAERVAKMELARRPAIGKGYVMQSSFGGKIYDQDFVDVCNKFFGNEPGSKILRPIADMAGIWRITKAALDLSFHAIQGQPAFGLAFSYMITNPKLGARLMAEWFRAHLCASRSYLQPEWVHAYLNKYKEDGLQRVSFGGSSQAIDYFAALHARKGLGALAAKAMAKIPGTPYERAELAFYGAGELLRDVAWRELKGVFKGHEFDLARFIDRMTGIINTEAIGVPITVRQLESSFIWFAPRYTRACLTLLSYCFRGGVTGRLARRAFAGMIAGGALFYSGIQYAISALEGKDDEECWRDVLAGFGVEKDPITDEWAWKPSARIMTFKIGNYYFGIGGFWYGMVRLFGNIMATINEVGDKERIDLARILKYGSLNRRDNPFLAWWYSRSSPMTGFLFEVGWPLIKSIFSGELLAGKDFLGYPIETPWQYARYLITRFEPIWMEQGLNPYIPFFARDEEIPEGIARAIVPIVELFGLRTFPESDWIKFYDYANEEILARLPEDLLKEYFTEDELPIILEAQGRGELRWKHLPRALQIKLLSMYPELNDLYGEAQASSLIRNSDAWKLWKARQEEEQNIYYDRGNSLINRLRTGEFDTRGLREMWSDAGQNYGIALESIEKEPAYEQIYDFFAKREAKGLTYDWALDLALMEYQQVMFADYTDAKGDYDWDAKDRALATYIEEWGEDTYEIIRKMYVERRLLEGLDPALVRLAEDKDKLGREYWRLPYRPIIEMDEDDELRGNIPAEFYVPWTVYQALKEGRLVSVAQIEKGIEHMKWARSTHTSDSEWDKEWRAHYDDIVTVLEEIRRGEINERRIHHLIHVLYEDIRLDKASEEDRISKGEMGDANMYRHAYEGFQELVDVLSVAISPEKAVEQFLEEHPDLTKDWRAEHRLNNPEDDARLAIWGYGGRLQSREAYDLVVKWGQELGVPLEQMGLGLPPPNLADAYFDYNKLEGALERKWFRQEHPGFETWGQETYGWKPIDEQSITPRGIYDLFQEYTKAKQGKARLVFRHEHPDLEKWLVEEQGYTPVGDRWKDGD